MRSFSKMLCIGGAWLLVGCAASAADHGCRYGGNDFSHGATVCQSGTNYRCDDGRWDSLATACEAKKSDMKSCDYDGQSFSSGSASCQSGTQYRCLDGAWKNLAVACAPNELQAASNPAPRTCMLDGTTVASASTV
jgi:hypothetical protein